MKMSASPDRSTSSGLAGRARIALVLGTLAAGCVQDRPKGAREMAGSLVPETLMSDRAMVGLRPTTDNNTGRSDTLTLFSTDCSGGVWSQAGGQPVEQLMAPMALPGTVRDGARLLMIKDTNGDRQRNMTLAENNDPATVQPWHALEQRVTGVSICE